MKKSILKMMAEGEAADAEKPKAKPTKLRRTTSPVIGSVNKALNNLSDDIVVSINPDKIDPSPFRDRFQPDADAEQELEELMISLKEEGQKIAVLVRPHPSEDGRFQLAYGHRRTAALRALHSETDTPEKFHVRAYVRDLTDDELLKEQSVENAVRENLSWIEMAVWAKQLKAAGIKNRAMAPVLGVPESGVSRMLSVADRVPVDIIHAVGRAKGIGYRPWMALADLATDTKAAKRIRSILDGDDFLGSDSERRLSMAMSAAKGEGKKREEDKPKTWDLKSNGAVFGKIKQSQSKTTVTLPKEEIEFANWLTDKMGDLRSQFLDSQGKKPGR